MSQANVIRRIKLFIELGALLLLTQGCAWFDPFRVSTEVPESPRHYDALGDASGLTGPAVTRTYLDKSCGARPPHFREWAITDVLHAALCRDARSRRSWADVVTASARLGSQYSEFLPTISSNTAVEDGHSQRIVPLRRNLDVGDHLSTRRADVGLSWVLFDGGVRIAKASAAEDYLLAQRASHNEALLTVFSEAAQSYFRAISLRASVEAKREAETAAQDVYRVSAGRHQGGIAPLSDVLQAETALHQATLDKLGAEGDFQVAKGQLASLVGLASNADISLLQPKFPAPSECELGSINELIQEAERKHPSIIGAAAQLAAKQSESRAAAVSDLPTVSFTTDLNGSLQTGDPSLPSKTRYLENTFGIQIKIPLSLVGSSYTKQEAVANVAAARADLDNAELKVAQDVWTAYQHVKTDVRRYVVITKLVSASERSFVIASGRYRHGVGGILEVLNAQSALASARQQQIEIQSSFYSDRLVLSASLGRLDFPDEESVRSR